MPISRHPSPSTEFRMPWCKNGRFAFRTSVHATQNGRLACRMSITISRIVFWSFWAPQPFIPAWRKNPSLILHCDFFLWISEIEGQVKEWRIFLKFIFVKSAICHKLRLTFSFITQWLVADKWIICHYLPLICHSKCYMRINKLACLWQSGR